MGPDVEVREDPAVAMVVAARVRVRRLIVVQVVGMVIEVAMAIGVATMGDVRVVVTVIGVVQVVIMGDSVAQWVLDVAPAAMVLADNVEIVVTGSALQTAVGKKEVFLILIERFLCRQRRS